MQEIDLVGDKGKERVFLYQSPEVAGTLPRQDEHVSFICNADGIYLYTVPSFCLRGKKIGSVFRGEEAYYFCPDRHVNRYRFTYGNGVAVKRLIPKMEPIGKAVWSRRKAFM